MTQTATSTQRARSSPPRPASACCCPYSSPSRLREPSGRGGRGAVPGRPPLGDRGVRRVRLLPARGGHPESRGAGAGGRGGLAAPPQRSRCCRFRVIGWIDDEVAVGVGIALAIVANAVTIFATAFIGQRVTGSRRVGIAAAALFTFWPFLIWLLARGADLGEQRLGDRGGARALHRAGLDRVRRRRARARARAKVGRRGPWWRPGSSFGYATAVRPTNIVFAAAAAILFASERDWRSVGPARRRRRRGAPDHARVPAEEAWLRPRARTRPDRAAALVERLPRLDLHRFQRLAAAAARPAPAIRARSVCWRCGPVPSR